MTQEMVKIVSAKMLPNLRLLVKFDNGETRYVKTELLDFVVKQTSSLTMNLGGFGQPSMDMYWWGEHTNIIDDGKAIDVDGKIITADELWAQGTKDL